MGTFYGRTGIDYRNTLPEGMSKLKRDVHKNLVDAALLVGDIIREKAHDHANVSSGEIGHAQDGGHMRDRIDVGVVQDTPGKIEVRIGLDLTNVPYAPHQEFGPRGKPFLRPAVDESRSEAHDILQGALDGTPVEDASRFVRFNRGKA